VPDAAIDDSMRVFTRKFLCIGRGIRVRCSVGITFKGYCGDADVRIFGEVFLNIVVLRFAFG
jgi:hypothetical protein